MTTRPAAPEGPIIRTEEPTPVHLPLVANTKEQRLMTATPITADTVPDIWFKAKRVIRTAIAVTLGILITLLSLVAALQLFAPAVLAELSKVLDPQTIAWLSSALAVLVLWAGVITRIMAIPQDVHNDIEHLGTLTLPLLR